MFARWNRSRRRPAGAAALGGRQVQLAMPAGAGRLECQVLDPVGLPMKAEVAVLDGDGRAVVQGGSDPYGLFAAAVPPGGYQVSVTADGYQPRRTHVQVAENTRTVAGSFYLDTAPQPPLPAPGRWDIDPAHTTIRFVAKHIGLADVHGRFNTFQGALWVADRIEDSQLEVVIEAASIDTGVKMRDDHLRSPDFLDVETYPYLQFTGDRFIPRGGSHWTVAGVLHLHGVARSVRLDTTYLGLGTGMEGEARAACQVAAELHREDFTLNWQGMLARGIAVVGATIRVELDIQVIQATPGS